MEQIYILIFNKNIGMLVCLHTLQWKI